MCITQLWKPCECNTGVMLSTPVSRICYGILSICQVILSIRQEVIPTLSYNPPFNQIILQGMPDRCNLDASSAGLKINLGPVDRQTINSPPHYSPPNINHFATVFPPPLCSSPVQRVHACASKSSIWYHAIANIIM